MSPKLTIGFSCLAERVHNITVPEHGEDIEVVVCVQGDGPDTLGPDVRLVKVDGVGVARSRNAAIDAASGRYLLFCDDDINVNLPGVRAGVRRFERSDHAIILGQSVGSSGQPRKNYPGTVKRLTKFNTAKTATYEMLIDVSQVRSAGIRFDERFGAGRPLYLADEYIFVVDSLRAGLTGEAIPEVFGTHPDLSSGERWEGALDAHVRAVALNRVFGRWAPIARTAFAVKHWRELGDLRSVARFITDSARPPASHAATNADEG